MLTHHRHSHHLSGVKKKRKKKLAFRQTAEGKEKRKSKEERGHFVLRGNMTERVT